MSATDFGRIVSSLRKEARNELDEMMTQIDLADLAKIPLITLQKIEQGRQVNIKPEIVRNLANALNLSSYSRQAFFLSSIGMDEQSLYRPKVALPQILDDANTLLAHLQIPACIANSYGDIILTNPGFLYVLNIQLARLSSGHLISKNNLYRLFFSPEFKDLQNLFGGHYAAFARRCVLIFKAMTVKYRYHWYFQKILPELNRFPIFRQHWQSSAFHDEDIYMLSNTIKLTHPQAGHLSYLVLSVLVLTADTDLYLHSFQPLDAHTIQASAEITKELGTHPVALSQSLIPIEPDLAG